MCALGIFIQIADLSSRMWEDLQAEVSREDMFKGIASYRKSMEIPAIRSVRQEEQKFKNSSWVLNKAILCETLKIMYF